MATFASNGNFATSAMNLALYCLYHTNDPEANFYIRKRTDVLEVEDFEFNFRDDFVIVSDKDDPLDPVDPLTRSLSSLRLNPATSSDSKSTSYTSSIRSTGSGGSKAAPKSILKKPKGINDHTKPKKAVVWHTELAHNIINGEHVPQTRLSREEWQLREHKRLCAKRMADAEADAEWVDVSEL
ncbi:uncharacterized protein PG998_011101 [Apiospora kogelbergensis]|uniref:Uncharacterized protein n=1 Tax=Apiospora kogelbergensis TaxID=1337665 RepID=A0AAW0RCZ6_9PEZI